jgi:hypothetical protein
MYQKKKRRKRGLFFYKFFSHTKKEASLRMAHSPYGLSLSLSLIRSTLAFPYIMECKRFKAFMVVFKGLIASVKSLKECKRCKAFMVVFKGFTEAIFKGFKGLQHGLGFWV